MVASPAGGMNIEEVAAATPHLIFKEPVDIRTGPTDEVLFHNQNNRHRVCLQAIKRLVEASGFDKEAARKQASNLIRNLYKLFVEKDCTLIEINPLAETHDGKVLCIDAKLNFDDNAEFRQKEIFAFRDSSQEDPREVAAHKAELNYIGLDGNIGCLVNGAGLAMASMDAIKLHGGSPANFLDMGGGANAKQVTAAFGILNSDPQVDLLQHGLKMTLGNHAFIGESHPRQYIWRYYALRCHRPRDDSSLHRSGNQETNCYPTGITNYYGFFEVFHKSLVFFLGGNECR